MQLLLCGSLPLALAGCSSSDVDKDGGEVGVETGPCTYSICNGACVDLNFDEMNCGECGNACDESSGIVCKGGQCVCRSTATECGGGCVDLSTDPNNCGSCGYYCTADETCVNRMCIGGCEHNQERCDGACTNVLSDNSHCGDCETVCDVTKGQICIAGKCQ